MFTAFDLFLEDGKINDTINLLDYTEKGRRHLEAKKDLACESIKKYIINGIVDGTKIKTDWFSTNLKVDIFISHSHKDEDLVLGLAGWIYENFKLECFVDSCMWGYIDDLLLMINDNFSDRCMGEKGYIYNYKKSITASNHVNVMLSIALQHMIDKAEVTMLVNTNNSISKYEDIYETATYSPWIYTEIFCTQIIRHKPLSEYRKPFINYVYENVQENRSKIENELTVAYNVSLEHLNSLCKNDLSDWYNQFKQNFKKELYYLETATTTNHIKELFCHISPLDTLYKITRPKEFINVAENITKIRKKYNIF